MASPRWLDGHEFEQAPGVDDGQEDWHAAVHGVSKSRTWLSDWTEPIPVFLSGEFQGQRSLVGYSLWGRKELDTCEWVIAQGHTGPGQLVSLSVSISFYNNTLNVLSAYPTLFQCANSNNNSNLALILCSMHCLHSSYELGVGNGNPLQCSCLENPMDRGAWSTTVHGIMKELAWLNDWAYELNCIHNTFMRSIVLLSWLYYWGYEVIGKWRCLPRVTELVSSGAGIQT